MNSQYHHAATPFFKIMLICLSNFFVKKLVSVFFEIAITKEDKDLISIPMVKEERMSLYVSLLALKENNLHPEVENFFQELLN